MEKLIWCIIYILMSITITPMLSIEVNGDSDNCVLSLVIPKDSVKSSCSENNKYEMKLRSVESIISQLRREINDIKVKLAYTLSPRTNSDNMIELTEKVNSLEAVELVTINERLLTIENKLTNMEKEDKLKNDLTGSKKPMSAFSERLTKKKLVKIIKTTVKNELSGLENKIKASLMAEMQMSKDLFGAQNKSPNGNNRVPANAQSDTLYRQYTRHGTRHHRGQPINIEDGSIEIISEEINPDNERILPKSRQDGVQSESDNRFPNIRDKTDITQSDSEFGNGMHRLLQIFNQDLKEGLADQSQWVKDYTNTHKEDIDKKLSRVVRVIEGMKKTYDKKFQHGHRNESNEKMRSKIQELESHISVLAEGIESMKENLFNDPIIEERFMQQQIEIENSIAAKLYEADIPSKRELQNINDKVELKDAKLRNNMADIKVRTRTLEDNLTLLMNSIEHINATLFPDTDYLDNFDVDKLHHEMEIVHTIKFVKEVKELWPYIVHNVTEKDLMDDTDRQEIGVQLNNLLSKHIDLNIQDRNIYEKISSMNYSIGVLAERLADIENFNLKNALDQNKWVRFDFNSSYGRSGCHRGKKYVRRTKYTQAPFVGVELCSNVRYKIFLGELLNKTFLDVGDDLRGGEDHCEFVGASKDSKISVGKGESAWDEPVTGFKRRNWGEIPIKGTLSFFTLTPPWYECGVTIP